MKTLILLLSITFIQHSFAQHTEFQKIPQITIETYLEKYPELKVMYIPTAYGKAQFLEQEFPLDVNTNEVLHWDLVYTKYPENVNFDALNLKRLVWFFEKFPFLKSKVNGSIIGQTAAESKEAAEQLFHGFVLYYREKPTPETMKAEVEELKKVLENKTSKPTEEDKSDILSEGSFEGYDYISYSTYTCYDEDVKKRWETEYKLKVHILTKKEMALKVATFDPNTFTMCDKLIYAEIKGDTSYKGYTYNVDSTVFKSLNRNRWKNMLVVADVTGSMSPYTAQLLLWMKLNTGKVSINEFVAFNDGDAKTDMEKIIGKTGGIYNVKSNKYEEVSELIYKTMMKGGGGDAPENNIEALLKGITTNPNCENTILIADNWAPVKDISLLDKVNRPIRVIVCGSYGAIHPDYLTIAYRTGGSIHTIEEDIVDLMKYREGDIFNFKGVEYRIKDGKFVREDKIGLSIL